MAVSESERSPSESVVGNPVVECDVTAPSDHVTRVVVDVAVGALVEHLLLNDIGQDAREIRCSNIEGFLFTLTNNLLML